MPVGQGWLQLGELGLSFLLAAAIGLEREARQKSAGLRTYSLVGVSAALFMLISKYGFDNVTESGRVVVDPSRVAAQIVSGIGFIGGGVIFMRRDVVRGLTTAASVWLTAALGMACGAGLPILAVATTGGYFLIMYAYPPLVQRFMPTHSSTSTRLRIGGDDRAGLVGAVLAQCKALRFEVDAIEIDRTDDSEADGSRASPVLVSLTVSGGRDVPALIVRLSDIAGVSRAGSVAGDGLE